MSDPSDQDQSKGEPVKPIWFDSPSATNSEQSDGPNALNYRSPQDERLAAKESKNGSPIGFGFLGAISAIGTGALTIYLLVNEFAPPGFEWGFVFLMACAGIGGAIALNWVARWRGFFPGFLIGIGLFSLCPIVTVAIICGGIGK